MRWYRGLEPIIQHHVELGPLTWYRVGGAARYYCEPRDLAQLSDVLRQSHEHGVELRVLGAGANVLVRDDGFDGLVIRLDAPSFGHCTVRPGLTVAGAGCEGFELLRRTVHAGEGGLEVLAGIPGRVGGLVRMNAGGRFGCTADTVVSVRALDRQGQVRDLDATTLRFGYRTSNLADLIVTEVTFLTTAVNPQALADRHRDIWDYKKRTQPLGRNNAGCTFKNPPGEAAGALIERAGLKGQRLGGAQVSEHHANFIVAGPDARAGDILELARRVQARVADGFGITLEMEIDVW